MINRLIEFSLKNRFLILLVYALLAVWGYWALLRTPIDAIPDLSENQVIVYTDWAGRSPQEVEDQITYPLTVNLQGLAGVRDVRSSSALGFSMINIIFQDKIDPYFARTRVLERLNLASGFLPEGVVPVLGPDATGVGQVFWYTVEGPYDGGTLHSLQDWFIKYQLNSVSGVAEVASIGGWVRQYQIDVDPIKLRAYNIPLRTVIEGVQRSNTNVGAKVIEASDQEMAVRGIGLIRSTADLENIVLTATAGTPVYIRNVANVHLGPEFRRGVLDKDGKDVVGGVVVIRNGANAQEVISGVKAKLAALEPGLPKGVHIVPFYDRSTLILHAVNTLKSALLEEICSGHARARDLPVALPQHSHRHPAVAACGAGIVPVHALCGHLVQHHVARRNRDCDWRAGRCGHRDDGKRAPARRAVLRRTWRVPVGD